MTTETSPAADAAPETQTVETTVAETTETTAEKAKRASRPKPLRVYRQEANGALIPIKDSPDFSEARDAHAWMQANLPSGPLYRPVRCYPAVRVRTTLEEVEA